jgi:hypothetical protein
MHALAYSANLFLIYNIFFESSWAKNMPENSGPIWMQRILFGPPGCGKSYRVRLEAKSELGIEAKNSRRFIETTFHPEYSYGDFTAKLLPHSSSRAQKYSVAGSPLDGAEIYEHSPAPKIEYRIHVGPFIKALAVAYACEDPVLLAIDEINRGNCAHIFGDVFQLLDRGADGWSEYGVDMSDLFQLALQQELRQFGKAMADLPDRLKVKDEHSETVQFKLKLPPNLSILATMNTSDESVYYMDTAFKRRWDFLYMPWESDADKPGYTEHAAALIEGTTHTWRDLLAKLNAYIADNFVGRNVDDKQVGIWFLKSRLVPSQELAPQLEALRAKLLQLIGVFAHAQWVSLFPNAKLYDRSDSYLETFSVKQDFEKYGIGWPSDVEWQPNLLAASLIRWIDLQPKAQIHQISRAAIANKLMFFLWDNVFSRDRSLLTSLLRTTAPAAMAPRTFGEFATEENVDLFIEGLMHEPSAETALAA